MKALVGRRSWSQNFVRRHLGLHYKSFHFHEQRRATSVLIYLSAKSW